MIEDALVGGLEGDMLQTADSTVGYAVKRKQLLVKKKDRAGKEQRDGKAAAKTYPQDLPNTVGLFCTRILSRKGDSAKMYGVYGGKSKAFQIGGCRIAVDHGLNIQAVCRSIISEVHYNVQRLTGLTVKSVDVCVDSIKT